MSINEIESKVQELRQLQALIEEAEAEAEAITSSRLDTTALKKALTDVAERFTKTTTSRRFCVA